MPELSLFSWFFFVLAALFVGFTKTSVGGVGILAVVFMALAIPGKTSPGILLPILVFADVLAVFYYNKSSDWKILKSILPSTFIGVFIGYLLLKVLPDSYFNPIIGSLIVIMILLGYWVEKNKDKVSGAKNLSFVAGLFAGAASMISNAAGPILSIYLLMLGLDKNSFAGTRSWFFLIMNVVKLPFSAGLGLITFETLKLDLISVPLVLIGAAFGRWFLNWINPKTFNLIVRVTAFIAGMHMILKG